MTEVAPRTDRRRVRNRAALLGAAEALFAVRGVDAVSVDEIVGAADLAKGTFYNHFADKDALAREIQRGVRADAETRVGEVNAGVVDPAARVARALAVFAKFALEQPTRARVMARLSSRATDLESPLNRGLLADVTAGIRAERFAASSRDTAALFVMGTVQIALARVADDSLSRATVEKLVAELGAFLLRGLGVATAEAKSIAESAARVVREGEST
jgi:AcrR family transcriptional regulator